nr:putative zinc finger, CCHC-type [Tanacetum cinerariifolium]
MAKLAFCDYHNMVAILEKTVHNTDFHQIVDFLEASHIRYALTIHPTVYVSHIRQFSSTARVETTDGETKILAQVNGRQRTVSESLIRRHLKLNDEEGISTLPDNEIFKNLSLMGYNILPNQRFSFQKGQFSHQGKFLIHTIMHCLSPKSTSFNEFSSNIATALVCLATNRTYNFFKMIFDGMIRNVKSKGKFIMYPRFIEKLLKMSQFGVIKHTEVYSMPFHTQKGKGSEHPSEPHHTPSDQDEPIHHEPITQSSQHAQITSHELIPQSHEQTTSQEPTILSQSYSIITTPRRITRGSIWISQSKVPSPGADKTAFITGNVRYGETFPTDTSLDAGHDRENIAKTSALPHKALPRGDLLDRDKSVDKGSDSTDEMSHVLSYLGAINILASGGLRSVFITTSLSVATVSTEPEQPSTKKVLEQLSVQLARDLEAKFDQEDLIIREQAKRDSEIARIHTEKKLEMMIIELNRSNEIVEKYLSEYEQVEVGLSHDENVELINELLMYQRHLAQIKKYQSQQNKPATKTKKRNFYMSILRSNRPGIQLDKEGIKKLKTYKALGTKPTQEQQSKEPKELHEEELKKMMKLVPVEELYIEALHVKYPIIDWEIYFEGQRKEDLDKLWSLFNETCSTTEVIDEKVKELWVELKRLYEPDSRDPLWALQSLDLSKGHQYTTPSGMILLSNYCDDCPVSISPSTLLPPSMTLHPPAHIPPCELCTDLPPYAPSVTSSTHTNQPLPSPHVMPLKASTSGHLMVTRSKDGIFMRRHFADLSHVSASALHQDLFTTKEPKGFKSAAKDLKWFATMCDEMKALKLNATWDLVPRPTKSNIVKSKWVFHTKFLVDGIVDKFKARLVAQGFTQVPSLDYSATFSPVVKASTVRIILSLAVLNKWPLHQLDVKNAFLNGRLSDIIYIEKPP